MEIIKISNWFLLLTLTIYLHVYEIKSDCTESQIPVDPAVGADAETCVDPSTSLSLKWQKGDYFSFGGLDDFCLATGISDDPQLAADERSYTGVGSIQFPILDKLVKGSAWSYNAENVLRTAYIDWNEIRGKFHDVYMKAVGDKREEMLQRNITINERIVKSQKFTEITFNTSDTTQEVRRPLEEAEKELDAANAAVANACGFSGYTEENCRKANDRVAVSQERVNRYKAAIAEGDDAAVKKNQDEVDELNRTAAINEAKLLPFDQLLLRLNWSKDETPDFEAPNPYFVETSAIRVDGEILKNYLHFRVFHNRSTADLFDRLHSSRERKDNARGRIVALLIMVKDQDGWPVGDFSNPIPCSKTCAEYGKVVYSHNESNHVPCAYTPPTATTHPGMFVFPRAGEETSEGHQEMHATWSFSQDSCNFVTELHIQTLILEDFKIRPGPESYFTLDIDKLKENEEPRHHLYGWTARYDLIHPTVASLGAPDYVSIKRLREVDRRGSQIDCHVPLREEHGFVKGISPNSRSEVPSKAAYTLALQGEFPKAEFPSVTYYGQHLNGHLKCRHLLSSSKSPAKEAFEKFVGIPIIQQFLTTPGLHCPCPQLPTTPRPEDQTPNPGRLHGRLLHGSHMAMAWMVLVPLSWFVARYYKETFSSVFCLQEYWWYMWHICLILTAAAFGCGGILSVRSRVTHVKLARSNTLLWHNILGFFSFFLFYMQIFTGFFRSSDPKKRKLGIFLHFLAGFLNQISAIVGIIMIGFVKQSGMTCEALYATGGWLVFCIVMFVFMEVHIRIMDKKLALDPPRSYLPPPVKRLFGQDAPVYSRQVEFSKLVPALEKIAYVFQGRVFRIIVLGVFIIGLLAFYFGIITSIWNSEGLSCMDQIGNQTVEIEETQFPAEYYDDASNDED